MRPLITAQLDLPGLLCLQQAPVGCYLLLQSGLDVQQHPIFLALLFDAGAHVGEFCFKHVDCGLEASKHGAVTSLCLCHCVLQGSFLLGRKMEQAEFMHVNCNTQKSMVA